MIPFSAIVMLACAHVVAQNLPQHAQDQGFGIGGEADFNSVYVWRGIVLDNRAAVQPSFWVSGYGFDLTAWGSLALASRPDDPRLGAADLILTYTRSWKKLTLEPALEAYRHPSSAQIGDQKTMEGSLKLSYPDGPLRVFTFHAFDIQAYRGAYFGEAGVSYEGHVTKSVELASRVYSGWASSKFNDAYIGLATNAFELIGAEGSVTFYLKKLYLKPHLEFTRIAARRLRDELSSPSVVNFGLAVGVDF
jgi:hypothetical protein